jgi:hypothetical protein
MDVRDKVEYSLTGEGADKPPYNRFTVDAATGFVRIHDILDREERACYNVSSTGINQPKDWAWISEKYNIVII